MNGSNVGAFLVLVVQLAISLVFAIVLSAAAPKLKGWKRVAALIFAFLSWLGVALGLLGFLLLLLFGGWS